MHNLETVFFTSDNHFGHHNSVARPVKSAWGTNTRHQFGSVRQMDQGMIDAWNLVVPEDGLVYVLGDFVHDGSGPEKDDWTLRTVERTLGKLAGEKILIVGNHDLPFEDPTRANEYIRAGFSEVKQGSAQIYLEDKEFVLNHFPRWRGDKPRSARYPKPVSDWQNEPWLLHGHTHSQVQLDIPNKMIDVGVDAWSFRPVSAHTILQMARAAEELVDTIHTAGRIAPNSYRL